MLKYLHKNYYLKVKKEIPTDLPLNTVWWYFIGQRRVVRRKRFGRRRRNIIILNRTLKKQILIKALNTLEALAYMKNRFLLLNMLKDPYEEGDFRYRVIEKKEWIPGHLLREFCEEPKIEEYINRKKFLVRREEKKFPSVLINLLAYPADIQISEVNNINILSFSFCGIITKSFIISKFRIPFNLRKGSHTRILRKIILNNILRKSAIILRKVTLIQFENLLCNIRKFNLKLINKTLKKRIKNKSKYIIINKHNKKVKSKYKIYYSRKKRRLIDTRPLSIKKPSKKVINYKYVKFSRYGVKNLRYLQDTDERYLDALEESLRIKIPPQTFVFGRQLK